MSGRLPTVTAADGDVEDLTFLRLVSPDGRLDAPVAKRLDGAVTLGIRRP